MYSDVLLFIDGHWAKAAGGRTIPVVNPATGGPVGTVAHADRSDLDRALEAAEKGFRQWRKVSAFASADRVGSHSCRCAAPGWRRSAPG
jgi:succinate-semialdehyde dehydrogenase/glutarate-semialdehyde dehydrogenase